MSTVVAATAPSIGGSFEAETEAEAGSTPHPFGI